MKILVVDDNEDIADLISCYLKSRDHDVFVAYDGKEAVETFKNQKDMEYVLLDIKMPEMNGIIAYEEMKKINSNCNFVFISATDDPEIEGVEFLEKPFGIKDIKRIIKEKQDG